MGKLNIDDDETDKLIKWFKIKTVHFLPQSKLRHYSYKSNTCRTKEAPDVTKEKSLKKQPEFVAAYEVLNLNDGFFYPISEDSKSDKTLRCFTKESIDDLGQTKKII